jgi:hypothetical protein
MRLHRLRYLRWPLQSPKRRRRGTLRMKTGRTMEKKRPRKVEILPKRRRRREVR